MEPMKESEGLQISEFVCDYNGAILSPEKIPYPFGLDAPQKMAQDRSILAAKKYDPRIWQVAKAVAIQAPAGFIHFARQKWVAQCPVCGNFTAPKSFEKARRLAEDCCTEGDTFSCLRKYLAASKIRVAIKNGDREIIASQIYAGKNYGPVYSVEERGVTEILNSQNLKLRLGMAMFAPCDCRFFWTDTQNARHWSQPLKSDCAAIFGPEGEELAFFEALQEEK